MPLIPAKKVATDLGQMVFQGVAARPGQVGFGLLSLLGTTGIALTASAQPLPVEAMDPALVEQALQAASSGDPWAMVVFALVLISGQVVGLLRDAISTKKREGEVATLRVVVLEKELVELTRANARLEAREEVHEEESERVSSTSHPNGVG